MKGKPKPQVQLVGQDGNVFNLLGICTRALKKAGQYEEAQELRNRVLKCGSYDEALMTMLEYVEDNGEDPEDGEVFEEDYDDSEVFEEDE
jgi:two-component SAPR family response regulator